MPITLLSSGTMAIIALFELWAVRTIDMHIKAILLKYETVVILQTQFQL